MVQDRSKAAVGISMAAVVAATLAWVRSRRAQAAPGAEFALPEEFIELIAAIGASVDTIDSNVARLITELTQLAFNVQGWPENADSGTALRPAIATTGTRMPFLVIPSGFALVIKSWFLNPGLLQVGFSLAECLNVNQAFTLLPNETVNYYIKNANAVYISATAAGCFANLTVEQRRGGGG